MRKNNKQGYNLRLSDWIPYIGFKSYLNRNEPNDKALPRGQILHWYNKSLAIGAFVGLVALVLSANN